MFCLIHSHTLYINLLSKSEQFWQKILELFILRQRNGLKWFKHGVLFILTTHSLKLLTIYNLCTFYDYLTEKKIYKYIYLYILTGFQEIKSSHDTSVTNFQSLVKKAGTCVVCVDVPYSIVRMMRKNEMLKQIINEII